MKKLSRPSRTFATVVAGAVVIAVASTGGAVASGLITSAKIKNNTIQSIDVKNNNLTGTDIKDGSLTGTDVADGSIGSGDLGAGAVKASKLGTIVTRESQTDIANGAGGFVQVSCLAGETLISGGATTSGVGTAAGWNLIRSSRITNGWDAAARNNTGSTATLIVQAYCLQ